MEATHTIVSSHGYFVINSHGAILRHELEESWDCEMPIRFDVNEYWVCYGRLDSHIDVLDIGYWFADGSYEPAAPEWRREIAENMKAEAMELASALLILA